MRWSEIVTISVIAVLAAFWFAQATSIPGTVVSSKVTSGDTANTFPVADTSELQGGFVQLQHSSELRDIPEARRKRGMFAYAADSRRVYQLYSSPGHYWREWLPGSGGAAVDVSLYLTVLRFLGYSAAGRISPTDARLSDARTPLVHGSSHEAAGSDPLTLSQSQIVGLVTALSELVPGAAFRDYTGLHSDVTKGEKGDPGFDGRDGPDTLRCQIIGGARGIIYDADGGNPQPASLGSYVVYLYQGDTLLTATSYEWYNPILDSLITSPPAETDGMQYRRQYYQPGVFPFFSSAKSNNYVSVMVGYSSAEVPFGKRYCNTSVNVSASKVGTQGIQGPEGAAATVTEAATISAFATTASDSYLSLQNSYSAGKGKIAVKDRLGNVKGYWRVGDTASSFIMRNYSGNADLIKLDNLRQTASISLLDRVGYERLKLINDGSMQIKSSTGLLWLTLNSTSKTLTMYGTDGSTPVFTVYSDGTWKGQEGWPSSSGLVLSKTTAGVGSWVSGGTGGSETQATILDKINDPAAGMTLERQAATTDNYSTAMIRVRGSNTAWRFRVDTKGQISIFRNGRRIFGIMTTGGGSVVIGG